MEESLEQWKKQEKEQWFNTNCPVCLGTICQRKLISSEQYLYRCSSCAIFGIDFENPEYLIKHFDDILRNNIGEDIVLNYEKRKSYRDGISKYLRTHFKPDKPIMEIVLTEEQAKEKNQRTIKQILEQVDSEL